MDSTQFRPRHALGLTAAAAMLVAGILTTPAFAAAQTADAPEQAPSIPADAGAADTGLTDVGATETVPADPLAATADPGGAPNADAAADPPMTDEAAPQKVDAEQPSASADTVAPSAPTPSGKAEAPESPTLTEKADAPLPQPSAGIPTRAIQGTARDMLGNPVDAMTLYLTGTGVELEVQTAADGTFAYPEVPVGSYAITGFDYPSGLAPFERVFTLVPGDGPFTLDPQFPLYSSLSGRVTAGSSIGIEGVTVEFHYTTGAILSTLTDANGEWSAALAPGQVRVLFIGPAAGAFAYEWYHEASSGAGAALLTLPETGTDITGIDAALELGGHIRGHVYDGANVTSNASVTVWEADGTLVAELVTDATGSYVTPALPLGDYVVQASDGLRRSDKVAVAVTSTFDVFADCVLEIEIAPAPVPVANDDVYTTPSHTLLQVTTPGLLANDLPSDPAANELHVANALMQEPAHGEVIVAGDGSFVYQPDDGFVGDDTFRYAVESPGGSASARVTIHVAPGDDAGSGTSAGQHGASGALAVTGVDAAGVTAAAAAAATLVLLGTVLAVRRRVSRSARETRV
jgi:hypothetical protein